MGADMARIKFTTWNAEWLEYTAGVDLGWVEPGQRVFIGKAPTKEVAAARIEGLKAVVSEVDPDILFLCEAVVGVRHMSDFVAKHMPGYDLVVRQGGDDGTYGIKGNQWLWFLVKKALSDSRAPELVDNLTWKDYTAKQSKMGHKDGQWTVSIPRVKDGEVLANIRKKHGHYRHPQALALNWNGQRVEFIGLHLKSKLVSRKPRNRRQDEDFEDYAREKKVSSYLAESHMARIKLTTEATDVRYYIDQRFDQEGEPSIVVLGDLNDGPGKELLEREYLFHDLIGNLQGEIFFADRFLNHALFDSPGHLRWTVKFKDFLDPDRPEKILLDHILFTQAMTRGGSGPLFVPAGAGLVEHEIYERITSLLPRDAEVSDHRPVSVVAVER
jgi:hypothetical protein